MKIQPISNFTHFNGLLGKESRFVDHQSLYGGEYDCDYYERDYHPFADETENEIRKNMFKLEQEINAEELENAAHTCSGTYTSLKQAHPLAITKADYKAMIKGVATKHLEILG